MGRFLVGSGGYGGAVRLVGGGGKSAAGART